MAKEYDADIFVDQRDSLAIHGPSFLRVCLAGRILEQLVDFFVVKFSVIGAFLGGELGAVTPVGIRQEAVMPEI